MESDNKLDTHVGIALDAPATLKTVLRALGSSLLNVLAAPRGVDVPVRAPVIFDAAEELPEEQHAILLLVGARPSDVATEVAIMSAAEKGYGATVVKLRAQDPRHLVDASTRAGVAVLVAADDVPWRRLDSLLTAAVGVAGGASDARSPEQPGDMFSLANAVAGVLGGAVAIEDAGRNVVAYSTLPGQRIDKIRREGILARRIPDLSKHDQQYRDVHAAKGTVRYPFDTSVGELPRVAVPIRAGNEVLGSIWVIEEHPPLVADSDAILKDAAKVAALYLIRRSVASDIERQAKIEMLQGLLEGRVPVASAARALGLQPTEEFALVGFACQHSDAESVVSVGLRLAEEVERYASAFRPNASVAVDGTVYVLLPGVRDEASAVRFAREAVAHAGQVVPLAVHGAVARLASDPALAPRLRDEIDDVIRVLSADRLPTTVVTGRQMHNRILLGTLLEALERDSVGLHPGIEALVIHDRDRDTTYGATMLAYFNADGNVSEAAAALIVHPNTLRYRLRRAKQLFGLDLDDADERLLIWMQLRLVANLPVTRAGGRHPQPHSSAR